MTKTWESASFLCGLNSRKTSKRALYDLLPQQASHRKSSPFSGSISNLEDHELSAPPEPPYLHLEDSETHESPIEVEQGDLEPASREPSITEDTKDRSPPPSPGPASRSPTPLPQTPPPDEDTPAMSVFAPPDAEDEQPLSVDKKLPNDVAVRPSVQPFIIPTPDTPVHELLDFQFDPDSGKLIGSSPSQKTVNPADTVSATTLQYTLPPLKMLPLEYLRKSKPTKSRKREKERERSAYPDGKKDRDDWTPMGLHRWAATIRANPTWKRVARASKCLDTRQWTVSSVLDAFAHSFRSLLLDRYPGADPPPHLGPNRGLEGWRKIWF
jgi:chromatin modification-related protein VID21